VPRRGLYLVDKDGFEYGFSADMAKHTNLYAVMRDGKRVPWTGSPPVQGVPATDVVLADDRFPTEQELLAAKELGRRGGRDQQAEQVAMQAQQMQVGRTGPGVEGNEYDDPADAALAVPPGLPSVAGGTGAKPSDYAADQVITLTSGQGSAPPPPPPLPAAGLRRPVPPIRPGAK
jgi:hypothetical protein